MEKKCSICSNVLLLTDFYKDSRNIDQLSKWCKICEKNKKLKASQSSIYDEGEFTSSINDRKEAKNILQKMGYNVDDPNYPVAQQFAEKYGFPYKK